MRFFGKKKDENILSTDLIFYDGLNLFFKGQNVELFWNEEERKVTIQSKYENKETKNKSIVHLSADKINKAAFMSETKIIEQQKSVAGRAVAGGILLGPLGAVLGGMTGIKDKQKKDIKNFVIINYNDDKVLTFEIPAMNFSYMKIIKAINNHLVNGETEIEL